jgi:hypothetical protein
MAMHYGLTGLLAFAIPNAIGLFLFGALTQKLAAKHPYQRAYLPVNRLQHDGTLWNW